MSQPVESPPPVELPPGALCLDCNYPLRGLAEHRCPECGRAFDPAVRSTVQWRGAVGPVARAAMKPIGWPSFVIALLVAGMTLYANSVPGGYFDLKILSGAAWFGLGSLIAVRSALRIGVASYYRRPMKDWMHGWGMIVAIPLLFVGTMMLASSSLPTKWRFTMARPVLSKLAVEVIGDPTVSTPTPRRVGSYLLSDIQPIPGGMRCIVKDAGFLDRAGFAYSPDAPPPVIGEDYYRPMGDGWYEWRESW